MSATPSYTVFCDGDECDAGTPNGALEHETAASALREAARQGWAVAQPGGKDYCPECVADGTMRAQNARERVRRSAVR